VSSGTSPRRWTGPWGSSTWQGSCRGAVPAAASSGAHVVQARRASCPQMRSLKGGSWPSLVKHGNMRRCGRRKAGRATTKLTMSSQARICRNDAALCSLHVKSSVAPQHLLRRVFGLHGGEFRRLVCTRCVDDRYEPIPSYHPPSLLLNARGARRRTAAGRARAARWWPTRARPIVALGSFVAGAFPLVTCLDCKGGGGRITRTPTRCTRHLARRGCE